MPAKPYTITRKKEKEPINKLDKFQIAFLNAIKNMEEPPKPVKWWKPIKESFAPFDKQKDKSMLRSALTLNPALRLNVNLGLSKKKGKYTDVVRMLSEGEEKDYISGLDEIAKGIDTAGHNLGTTLGTLLFGGTDLIANTDFMTKFEKIMEKSKPEEPETWRGDLTSLMLTFGVPGVIITKIGARAGKIGQIAKLTNKFNRHKASKIALRAINSGAIVGATDFLVNYPGRPTFFVEPESTKGLTGKKKAAVEFKNRLKFGLEGTLIGLGFPLIGKAIQQGYKYALRPVGEPAIGFGLKAVNNLTFRPISWAMSKDKWVLPKVSKGIRNTGNFAMMKVLAPMYASRFNFGKGYFQLPPYEEWRLGDVLRRGAKQQRLKRLDNLIHWFRTYGKAPVDIENVSEVVLQYIKHKARKVDRIYQGIENRAYRLAKEFEKRHNTNRVSPVGERYFLDEVESFLRGQRKLTDLPQGLREPSVNLKENIESIMKEFSKALPKGKEADDVVEALNIILNKDLKNYFIKSFKTFTNPNYTPDESLVNNAANWLAKNVVKRNKDYKKAAQETYKNLDNFDAMYVEYGKDLVRKILTDGRGEGKNPLLILKHIGQQILRDKKYKFLNTGEELPDAIQKLLGVEKNLKASIMFTVTDTVAANAQKRAADFVAASGLKNGWLFKDEASALIKYPAARKISNLPQLGNHMQSKLTQLYTSPEYVEMLQGVGGVWDRLVRAGWYRKVLMAKALIQSGKTLYSPQTQVRNVTAGTMFALLSGHIGHNASVADSIRIVMRDIFKPGRGIDETAFNDYLAKLIRLGVNDENVIASELRAVFKQIKEGSIKTEEELFEYLLKHPTVTEKVARIYAGGDNLWKTFGFEFDKSMLSQGLKSVDDVADWFKHMGPNFSRNHLVTQVPKSLDDALDEAAAYLIRNSYPTYSKVPPAIKNIRKMPVGNFVSFPAEIFRTVPTNISMALKMVSHPNAVIRQMGYRRLMGTSLTLYGIGKSVSEATYYLTNSSQAQWEAYQRSAAASWDKNKNLVAIKGWEDGESAFINFSYFNPYDLFEDTIEAYMNKAYQDKMNPQDVNSYILQQLFAEDGPAWEFFAPFMSEPIGFDKFLDITMRGGKTAEGFTIYTDSDVEQDLGAVVEKSFFHILNGIKPGILTSAEKVKMGIEGDLTRSGKEVDLFDEFLAITTGTRIVRVDVKKDLQYIASNLNRIRRSVDETENFYTPKHWKTHTPNDMVEQYIGMMEEDFRLQKEVYMKVKDFMMLDLGRRKIENLLEEYGINPDLAFNLVRGKYTPINYSEPRFEKKIKYIKEWLKKRAKENPGDYYSLSKSYVFPERKFDRIIRKYDGKKFFEETWDDETGQYIGGYYPERVSYLTDKKGNLVLDENQNPIPDPNFSQRMLKKWVPRIKEGIKRFISPIGDVMGKAPTPPLPQTPMPDKRLAATTQINPATQLTQTESALLSPSEQIIKQRQRGTTT